MICNRTDCFAFSVVERNNCSALTEAKEKCNFYKSKADHERQRVSLIMRGKPYFEPARSYYEWERLKLLLSQVNDGREDNIHQTGSEHT